MKTEYLMVRKLTGELGGLVSGLSPAVSSLHDLRKASAYIFKHNIKLRLWSCNWDPNTLFFFEQAIPAQQQSQAPEKKHDKFLG